MADTDSLKAAIDEAQSALEAADLDAKSQLRVLRALEKVVAAHREAGTDEADYETVARNLEERRETLRRVAERSLKEAAKDDDEGELQGVLAGSHQVLRELAPDRARRVERRAEELGQRPFFSRFLQGQDDDPTKPITMKAPSDKEDTISTRRSFDFVTRKFPSDWEDSVTGKEPKEPPKWVTLKYPSDDDEIVTLKYPSDSDEPSYG